ncbi:MAG: cysteinyl-tRNA synthetase [Actinomycetota bacterium]|jgi:cysteinyl-tRNA synthetase
MSSVTLRLFNTLTREISEFVPIAPPRVGLYSCGPTVYYYSHIGNMRTYVFADTLRRVLEWKGFEVRHVINITDVGHLTSDADEGADKLEEAAKREHRNIWEIAEHYTRAFMDDIHSLRITDPHLWSKATDHIAEMIRFAEGLVAEGWCYELPSGLYFDTSKDEDYGAMARLDLEGQREGARVETVDGKRNPSDFAIWRTSAPGENRQMEWNSPWGRGAPGWHLECSVMSIEHLGEHFDIHTGGVDHIPVHHTNEIAQSEAFLGDGATWVPWWIHGEFINLKGAKLSKSKGDSLRVTELDGYHPLVYRYLLLQAHYRSQAEFTWDAMDSARTGLRRLLDRYASARTEPTTIGDAGRRHLDEFDAAVSDDLNTARALAAVSAASRDESLAPGELSALAVEFDKVLAIGLTDLVPTDLDLRRGDAAITDAEIDALVAERDAARAARDFAKSDELRDRLTAIGVVIEDRPGAHSEWRWS